MLSRRKFFRAVLWGAFMASQKLSLASELFEVKEKKLFVTEQLYFDSSSIPGFSFTCGPFSLPPEYEERAKVMMDRWKKESAGKRSYFELKNDKFKRVEK